MIEARQCKGCPAWLPEDAYQTTLYCNRICRSQAARKRKLASGRLAECHPDKPLFAKGLCQLCYIAQSAYTNSEAKKSSGRAYHLKTKYNIDQELFEDLLSIQNYKCKICHIILNLVEFSKPDGACVDHDHQTGLIRGILCKNCNTGLGMLKDSPDILLQALTYLEINNPARYNP